MGYEIPGKSVWDEDTGSIIVVVATDAPLLPQPDEAHREARDAGSGAAGQYFRRRLRRYFHRFFDGERRRGASAEKARGCADACRTIAMDALFEATVQATEEAVVNALVAAKTMTGADGHTVEALPHDRLREVLKKYNRLADAK